MLIIKGICLLFSHLPTSHTTVRAVPHTAVPILGAIRDIHPIFSLLTLRYRVFSINRVMLSHPRLNALYEVSVR